MKYIIMQIYFELELKLEWGRREIKVDRGMRQGDVMSGITFIKVVEDACEKLEWDGKGINVDGKWLTLLMFVDDLA